MEALIASLWRLLEDAARRALARIGIDTMYSYVISHTCHGCCLNITFRRHRTGT